MARVKGDRNSYISGLVFAGREEVRSFFETVEKLHNSDRFLSQKINL